MADRVAAARELAAERGVRCNAELPAAELDEVAPLAPAERPLLEHRLRVGSLSGRGVHRIRRVARTIADLGGRPGRWPRMHVCLALGLRAESASARRRHEIA